MSRGLRAKGMLALPLLAALVLSACPAPTTTGSPPPDLIAGLTRPSSVDPAHLQGSAATLIVSHVFETLMRFDRETLELEGGLAESWEVFDDGKRFVFTLREDAEFHDGERVQAADVVFALNRLADPAVRSDAALIMSALEGWAEFNSLDTADSISGLEAIGPDKVEFRLRSAWYDFPYTLTSPATSVISRGQVTEDPTGFVKQPIGSGPYRLVSPVEPDGAELQATDPDVRSHRVTVAFYDSTALAWRAFRQTELDMAEAPPGDIDDAIEKYGDRGFKGVAGMLYLGFNASQEPLDPIVRAQISAELPRSQIGAVYGGTLTEPTGLTPAQINTLSKENCLGPCGISDGPGGFEDGSTIDVPELRLDYPQGTPTDQLAALVKLQLEELPVARIDLHQHAAEAFFEVIRGNGHDLFPLTWVADYPLPDAFVRPLFTSNSPDNFTGFVDPEIDEALLEARSEQDPEKRRQAYFDIEVSLLDRGALMPLGQFRSTFAADARLGNFEVDVMGRFRLEDLVIRER